jgi:hypothetical protein
MNLRKAVIDGANWIRMAQDRVQWWVFVNTVMNIRLLFDKLSNYQLFIEYPSPWNE